MLGQAVDVAPNRHLHRYLIVAASDLLLAVRQSTTARKSSLLLDLTAHLAIRIAFDGRFGLGCWITSRIFPKVRCTRGRNPTKPARLRSCIVGICRPVRRCVLVCCGGHDTTDSIAYHFASAPCSFGTPCRIESQRVAFLAYLRMHHPSTMGRNAIPLAFHHCTAGNTEATDSPRQIASSCCDTKGRRACSLRSDPHTEDS